MNSRSPSKSLPHHAGQFYQDCPRGLRDGLCPETYLQIGTLHGDTVTLARCASIAINPCFQINQTVMRIKPSLFMFQMPRDDFFGRHNPDALFGKPVDRAFLDGMHLFKKLLRDFTNIEHCCNATSVIVMHDRIPLDRHMAVRDADGTIIRSHSRYPLWWTGDVWKFVAILQRHTPDLVIRAFNALPSGLIVVTNLDPDSRAPGRHYDDIVRAFTNLPDEPTAFADYIASLAATDTRELRHPTADQPRLQTGQANMDDRQQLIAAL